MPTLYYESHVTLAPEQALDRPDTLDARASTYGFRVANLVLLKPGPQQKHTEDAFLTGRARTLEMMVERTQALMEDLVGAGFTVRRYKIEAALIDSFIVDEWEAL